MDDRLFLCYFELLANGPSQMEDNMTSAREKISAALDHLKAANKLLNETAVHPFIGGLPIEAWGQEVAVAKTIAALNSALGKMSDDPANSTTPVRNDLLAGEIL